MLLVTLTAVVALYCAEHEIDNCPEVYEADLQSTHGIGLKGIFGRTKEGKRVICIDDGERGNDKLETFYHEMGHFIEETENRDARVHGGEHRRATKRAQRYYRDNKGRV